MDIGDVVLAGLLVLFGGLTAAGVLAFWGLQRIRRDPAWRRAYLQLRAAVTLRSGAREVARLRLQLQRAVEGARAAAAALHAAGRSSDVGGLMRRLSKIACSLDGELRLLAKEPDPGVRSRLLPETRLRVREAVGVATMIRGTAATVLWGDTDAELATLSRDAALELAAAQAGAGTGIGDELPEAVRRDLRAGAHTWMPAAGEPGLHLELGPALQRVARTVRSAVRAARATGHEQA